MNYKLAWCTQCQDYHRPPQPQNHKMFHTDLFATRYIPEIPDQRCSHCGRLITYNRAWGGWNHVSGPLPWAYKQCMPLSMDYTYAEPEPRHVP